MNYISSSRVSFEESYSFREVAPSLLILCNCRTWPSLPHSLPDLPDRHNQEEGTQEVDIIFLPKKKKKISLRHVVLFLHKLCGSSSDACNSEEVTVGFLVNHSLLSSKHRQLTDMHPPPHTHTQSHFFNLPTEKLKTRSRGESDFVIDSKVKSQVPVSHCVPCHCFVLWGLFRVQG